MNKNNVFFEIFQFKYDSEQQALHQALNYAMKYNTLKHWDSLQQKEVL